MCHGMILNSYHVLSDTWVLNFNQIMEQERIFTLIARKHSGDASGDDLEELDQMVQDIPELGDYILSLDQDDADKTELAYQQMLEALDKQNHLFFIRMSEQEYEEAKANTQASHSNPQSSFLKFLNDLKRKWQRARS